MRSFHLECFNEREELREEASQDGAAAKVEEHMRFMNATSRLNKETPHPLCILNISFTYV